MESSSASILILASVLTCGAANADTLISNLGATTSGSYVSSWYYGQSFTTGSNSLGYLLSGITTYSTGSLLAQGGGTIYVFSSQYTGLASDLATTETDLVCSAYCSSLTDSSWSFSNISLLADHIYYFYVDPDGATYPGLANGYEGGMFFVATSSSESITNRVTTTDYAFVISGTTNVPEPAAVASLAGLAALGFAALKRRNR
jgi:hypothetical protein